MMCHCCNIENHDREEPHYPLCFSPSFVADPRKGQEGGWRGKMGVTGSSLTVAAGWRGEEWVTLGMGEGIIKRARWQLQQVPSKRAELHWAELMASVEPGRSTATAANIWSLIISRWTKLGLITSHLPMGKASPVPQLSHKQYSILKYLLTASPVMKICFWCRKTKDILVFSLLYSHVRMWNLSLPEAFLSCQLLAGISPLTCWYNYTNDIIDSDE